MIRLSSSASAFTSLCKVDVEIVSIKIPLHLAVLYGRRSGNLCTSSSPPSCVSFGDDRGSIVLHPPGTGSGVIGVRPFFSPPHSCKAKDRLDTWCPVEHMAALRSATCFFTAMADRLRGPTVTAVCELYYVVGQCSRQASGCTTTGAVHPLRHFSRVHYQRVSLCRVIRKPAESCVSLTETRTLGLSR